MKIDQPDWFPFMKNLTKIKEAPAHTSALSAQEIREKQQLQRVLPEDPYIRVKTLPDPPVLGTGFQGNAMDGIPNDNSMAISTDGTIVSLTNSTIAVYDQSGAVKGIRSLDFFVYPFLPSTLKFDPWVRFDATSNRFIIVFLSGRTPSTSKLVLAFSQSSDPMAEWNLYAIPGSINPNTLLDYPQMGISASELFITANIADSAGLNTYGSSVWQISLADGYSGDNLTYERFQSNFTGLLPVSAQGTNYGPAFYFISTVALPAMPSQDLLIHRITGTLDDGGMLELPVTLQSPGNYLMPPLANQRGTGLQLNTNDCRVLDAYYREGRIQYVLNTSRNAVASIFYGTIAVNDLDLGLSTINSRVIWSDSAAVAYPSIAYGGCTDLATGKHSSVIAVNFSSYNNYPGCGAFYIDEFEMASPLAFSKKGLTFIGNPNTNPWRWGDYTAVVPHPMALGELWMAGSFGLGPTTHQSGTWIQQLFTPCYAPITGITPLQADAEVTVYPNPAVEMVQIQFGAPQSGVYRIEIRDLNGRLLALLVQDYLSKGEAIFRCNISHLPSGTYFLSVQREAETIHLEKVVVAR